MKATRRRGAFLGMGMLGILLLVAACGSEGTPTPAPTPTFPFSAPTLTHTLSGAHTYTVPGANSRSP